MIGVPTCNFGFLERLQLEKTPNTSAPLRSLVLCIERQKGLKIVVRKADAVIPDGEVDDVSSKTCPLLRRTVFEIEQRLSALDCHLDATIHALKPRFFYGMNGVDHRFKDRQETMRERQRGVAKTTVQVRGDIHLRR